MRDLEVKGHIRLENVSFRYPSRPDSLVLDDVSLEVPLLRRSCTMARWLAHLLSAALSIQCCSSVSHCSMLGAPTP